MSFADDLYAHLAADAAIAALVVDRIFPMVRKQGTGVPAITWRIVTGTPDNDLDGANGVDKMDLEVYAWAETYTMARDRMYPLVRARMAVAATSFKSLMSTHHDLFDEDSQTFGVLMNFSCTYTE